jgi:hypothetical protein
MQKCQKSAATYTSPEYNWHQSSNISFGDCSKPRLEFQGFILFLIVVCLIVIATLLCDVLCNKWQNCNKWLFFGGVTMYFIKDLDLSMLVNDAFNYKDCVVLVISKWIVLSMGGMILTGANWSTREKPVQVPLCPPQIPHGLPGIKSGLTLWEAMTLHLNHGMACAALNISCTLVPYMLHLISQTL